MTESEKAESSGSRPDLVRLADLVTHASLLLSQPTTSDQPRKYTRSRRGCLTCRLRKVKCDEVSPRCLRCAGMGRECTWDKTSPASHVSPKSNESSKQVGSASSSSSSSKPARKEPVTQGIPTIPASLAMDPSTASTSTAPSYAPLHTMDATLAIEPDLTPIDFDGSGLEWLPDTTTLPALSVISRLFEEGAHRSDDPHQDPVDKQPIKRKRLSESPQDWSEFVNMSNSPSGDLTTWASATADIDPNVIQLHRAPTSSHADAIALIPWTPPKTRSPPSKSEQDIPLSLSLASIASRRRGPNSTSAIQAHYNPAPTPALDPFMHAFPTASARGLFKHYVDNTSGIVTAMGRTKPGHNPFLAVSLPLILTDTASPACAALRFSLLTTAAAHILHLRGGDAKDVAELGDKLKKLAIGYTVISQGSSTEEDADLVLAASVIIMTRDVLSADRTWRSNLDFAIQSVRKRGGPEAMMERDPTSFTKRFVLEQIVTHEVFSCFTTGGEPTLLQPYAPWWFDVEKSSRSAWEWESVEQLFGISRAMVEVISRICVLCARKGRLGANLSLNEPDMAPVAAFLRNEAEQLIQELDIFGISLRSLPLHRRVQYGDHIYRMVMSLHLMTEILGLSADHPRVRAIVPAALELCSEVSMQPVMLVWPLLILSKLANPDERVWLQMLFKTYSEQYCRDLQTAEEIMLEMWKRQDRGDPPISWTSLMTECDTYVLLI